MGTFQLYLKSVGEVGYVESIRDVLIYANGLVGARIWEKVVFENDQVGVVNSISAELTEILLFSEGGINLGTMVARTGETVKASFSNNSLGRVLDVFGNPLDGRGTIKGSKPRYLEAPAPPMIDRARINQNLETGVTVVDILIPIGKGQRQLVIGDQKTGKTGFLLQAIARQAQLGTVCIYALIGKRRNDLASTIEKLKRFGVFQKTIIIAAPAASLTSIIYLAPFAALTCAEHFRDQGLDVLVVLDEITRHAKYFRELSNLSRKMPGRDGYPGDIFHLHAQLMERAGRFVVGEGSEHETLTLRIKGKTAAITCLPVVETIGDDFTGYIQTNLMAMTDGHLFFDVNRFQQGVRPAVNIGLSVTRVGKQTQRTVERDVAARLRKIIFDYIKAQDVAKFGVELLETTQQQLVIGQKLEAILEQSVDVIIPRVVQLLFLSLLLSGFWQETTPVEIKLHKENILAAYKAGKIPKFFGELEVSLEMGSIKRFSTNIETFRADLLAICVPKKN